MQRGRVDGTELIVILKIIVSKTEKFCESDIDRDYNLVRDREGGRERERKRE